MRFKKDNEGIAEGDLTPMIDMTFQLIAFFMVLVNFTEAEQDQRVILPQSMLAQEVKAPPKDQLTIQVTEKGICLLGGEEYAIKSLQPQLLLEIGLMEAAEAEVIIRAHQKTKTDDVQAIMEECQNAGFKKFKLRAKIPERRASGED